MNNQTYPESLAKTSKSVRLTGRQCGRRILPAIQLLSEHKVANRQRRAVLNRAVRKRVPEKQRVETEKSPISTDRKNCKGEQK